MGLFSGIASALGIGGSGGGSSSSSTNQTTVNNDITANFDLHFEELAQAQREATQLQSDIFSYAKQLENDKLSQEERERLQALQIKKIELLQTQEQIIQSKKNLQYTVYFGIVGVLFMLYQIFYKGKK